MIIWRGDWLWKRERECDMRTVEQGKEIFEDGGPERFN